MKNKTELLFNGVGILNLIIIIFLAIILPNEYEESYRWLVGIIEKYPLHNKGIYSESRPFLSFVITNYVAIFAPMFTLFLFLICIIFNIPSRLTKDEHYVINGIGLCISIFFLYFIEINVNASQNAPIGFKGDSLGAYIISIYACFIFSSLGIPLLLLRLREYLKYRK